MSTHASDLDLTGAHVANLTSADALAAFFTDLGYDTSKRTALTTKSLGLSTDAATPIRQIELLSEDAGGELRIVFVRLKSLTAKTRTDLARVLSQGIVDHLLVLASDFGTLEFVLLDKKKRERHGRSSAKRPVVIPVTVAVDRRSPTREQLQLLRRLTWTCRDGLEQYDKLRGTFEAAAFTEKYFQNRALFADHYLQTRLHDDPAWRENPSEVFAQVKGLLPISSSPSWQSTSGRWRGRSQSTMGSKARDSLTCHRWSRWNNGKSEIDSNGRDSHAATT